jgi:hypothetical protein
MPVYQFEREARTLASESYTVEQEGDEVGRLDLHFTGSGIVHATLCVPAEFDEDDIQELIAEIDERLVLTTDPYRDDFVVMVWRGERVGVYSEEDEEESAADDEDNGNGNRPIPIS